MEEVLGEEGLVVVNYGTLSRTGRMDQLASNIDLENAHGDLAVKMEVGETGETMGSDHQVLRVNMEEKPREILGTRNIRKYKMDRLNKIEFLKWMLRNEEQTKKVRESDKSIE